MERAPLFPFSIPSSRARMYAENDAEYQKALELICGHINALDVCGIVSADGTLQLNAWQSSDNGWITSAGRFWEKTVTLSPEMFSSFLEYELAKRAADEIIDEDNARLQARINSRIETLRSALVGTGTPAVHVTNGVTGPTQS